MVGGHSLLITNINRQNGKAQCVPTLISGWVQTVIEKPFEHKNISYIYISVQGKIIDHTSLHLNHQVGGTSTVHAGTIAAILLKRIDIKILLADFLA